MPHQFITGIYLVFYSYISFVNVIPKKKKFVVTVIWINLLVVLLYNLYKNFKITVALSTSSEDFNTKIGISIQTLNVTIYYNDFQCYRDIHAYHTEQIKNSF